MDNQEKIRINNEFKEGVKSKDFITAKEFSNIIDGKPLNHEEDANGWNEHWMEA